MKKIKWVAGAVALVAAGLGTAVMTGALPLPGKGGAQAKTEPAMVTLQFAPREVVQPVMARMPALVQFSGPLVAPATAVVKAKAAGTLQQLTVNEGQRVRAGQVIGALDLADARSRVAERQANVAAAQAALSQAQRNHASNQRLAAQQFISPTALDQSRSALETATAQANAAKASLDLAGVGLRDATLIAPIAGIVAKRHVLPGEKLSPEQPVLTIVDLQRLELAGSVGTHEVSRLRADLPVQVQVEGMAQEVAGRIARIAPAAEPGTRAIGVTIELANADERLRAGQYALVRVSLADDIERLTVPVNAIGQSSGQDHVWTIEAGSLARRAVTLGRRDPREGRVEVLQGLQPNSLVLASRFENLREGAKAAVVDHKALANAPGPAVASAAEAPAARPN